MNSKISLLSTFIISILTICTGLSFGAESFSTNELEQAENETTKEPAFFSSEENTKIAYFPYLSKNEKANMIVIHGGGAHSNAGYQHIAEGLSRNYSISTYLMDLRGHGLSGDERGDAIEVEYVYKDIQKLIEIVKTKSDKPVFLCGHSSGAGIILNYLTYLNYDSINGLVFISPELGYKSNTKRDNIKEPFAKAKISIFIASSMSGKKLFKHTKAVFFNYPPEVLNNDKLIVNAYTTNMSYACTPDNPEKQFSKIDKPVLMMIGENDEVIDPEKVKRYIGLLPDEIQNKSEFISISDSKHLSVLLNCESIIGDRIVNMINN
ncbi:MAG: alpha/beta fold hydrolase [Spirochaetes bacterium]|nr:alpha/beta fold hydrolase [Spirochaetota bacterium]